MDRVKGSYMNNYRKIKGKDSLVLEPEESYEGGYEVLAAGVYKLWDAGGMFRGIIPMFEKVVEGDKLVSFKTGIVSQVMHSTERFLGEESREIYKELKLTHKTGMIFYGKQGTGKTSTCMLIMKSLAERHEALCLDCTGKSLGFVREVIRRIREIQNNPLVIFVDEVEISIRSEESKYLTFLDGGDSVDNLIFIGCTNYIDKIPDRIKKRKSRIKDLYNINSLPLQVYKEYLVDRMPKMDAQVVSQFAYLAEEKGLTIDQLKHALIDYRIDGLEVEKAVKIAASFDIDGRKVSSSEEEDEEDDDISS